MGIIRMICHVNMYVMRTYFEIWTIIFFVYVFPALQFYIEELQT